MSQHIAVIGAGLAGLVCASRLSEAGFQVHVFDKSRGVSGRLSTRRGEGWQADHGAQYFTASDPAFVQQVQCWEQAGVVQVWQPELHVAGSTSRGSGAADVVRYVGAPSMTAPARALAAGLDVQLQATVQSVQRDQAGWRIQVAEEAARAACDRLFDAVVLAVPSPQAVPLLQACAPDLAAQALQAIMSPCWSAIARFDTPCDPGFDAAFVNEGALRWVARDSAKPGRPATETWVLHASPAWSEQHLEDAPEQVAEQLVQAFVALGGGEPCSVVAHRWRYAQAAVPLGVSFLHDAGLRLGVCGDWLANGTVEGAWTSGAALAAHLVQETGAPVQDANEG
ncbi:MAG: NAD(P)-binding protein [Alcaligenaceae bacterium]|nr:NAD(P)-binding protein [Alcaligenaceae bacterium]